MNFIIGVAFILLVQGALGTDYCNMDACNGAPHIACRNNGDWAPSYQCGTNHSLHYLTASDKQLILDIHNQYRQTIASGSVSPYSPAQNMKELIWDDELAAIACFNAKTCKMRHDKCRSTDKYPNAGQNLAIFGQSNATKPFREAYPALHNAWFIEHKYCGMDNIRKYQDKPTEPNKQIGHFTQLVADKAVAVGCCVSLFEVNGMKNTYIVCNYSYTNMMNEPVYIDGSPRCKTYSQKWKPLCAA